MAGPSLALWSFSRSRKQYQTHPVTVIYESALSCWGFSPRCPDVWLDRWGQGLDFASRREVDRLPNTSLITLYCRQERDLDCRMGLETRTPSTQQHPCTQPSSLALSCFLSSFSKPLAEGPQAQVKGALLKSCCSEAGEIGKKKRRSWERRPWNIKESRRCLLKPFLTSLGGGYIPFLKSSVSRALPK